MKAHSQTELQLPVMDPYPFRGSLARDKALQFFGMFQGYSSIANVCAQVARALVDLPGGVSLHSTNGSIWNEEWLAAHEGLCRSAPMALYWGIPETVPPGLFQHDFAIGSFVCETRQLPERWIRIANRFDLIVVPSRFCRDAFRDAGMHAPMLIVPHGIEEVYRPQKEYLPERPFIFFNALGKTFLHRKGTAVLLRAFKRAFFERTDVELRLRAGDPRAVAALLDNHTSLDAHPRVRIEPTQNLPKEEFARCYSEVHCTVHPTRGEGFGLIPLQSLACATPVIAPRHTGLLDTLESRWIHSLSATPPRPPSREESQPLWNLDENELVAAMLQVHGNYPSYKKRAEVAAPIVQERFAWPRVLAPFLEVMGALAHCESDAARQQWLKDRTATDGMLLVA